MTLNCHLGGWLWLCVCVCGGGGGGVGGVTGRGVVRTSLQRA